MTKNEIKDFLKENQGYLKKGAEFLSEKFNCSVETCKLALRETRAETKGNDFLNELDGEKIHNGTIKILHRPWEEGKGISLSSFNYAFELLNNTYDYWFFQEDDYKLMHNNYYKKGIKLLEEEKKVAYIGYDMYFWEGIIKKLL